ncbi:nitrite reductase (NAD(P)H) small subunit [Shigella flexneri]
MSQWKNICKIDDILPATGVCALLGNEQVAIFRRITATRCLRSATLTRSSSPACFLVGLLLNIR